MRVYGLLIRFLRIINEIYFVEIRATGREHVPTSGPVILAANHPSSILDSILLATQIHRPINYLARSGLFRFPLLATLFRRLGAVPIFRANEVSNSVERNVEVFEKVFDLLDQGGCVGIFPEGRNSPPTRIGPLRKGAARLALGAEARHDFALGLVLVPVGVNFENRGLLSSAVLLRLGQPIRIADYAGQYADDPEAAFSTLTEDIQRALSQQVLTIEDARLGRLVDELNDVFGDQLSRRFEGESMATPLADRRQSWLKRWFWRGAAWYRRATPESSEAFERRMHGRQHIKDVLVNAWKEQPREVVRLRNHLERYKDHLRQTELREAMAHSFEEPVRQRMIRLRMSLYAGLMAPVAFFGLVHNAVPYLVTKFLGRLGNDEAVRAFALFGIGLLAFGLSYFLTGYWLWRYTDLDLIRSMVYVAFLPPTGFAALRYRRDILRYRDRILIRTIFWNRAELIDLLRRERRLLQNEFEALASRYCD